MNKLHRVFVYGTLKQGEPNHEWFSKSKFAGGFFKFLDAAITVEKYPLIIGTKYNIPFLLYSPGNGERVHGEVYDVDDVVLKDLDVLEDHPNFYIRQETDVKMGEGDITKAWIYFIMNFRKELLETKQMLATYSDSNAQGLKYLEKDLREDEYYNVKAQILNIE